MLNLTGCLKGYIYRYSLYLRDGLAFFYSHFEADNKTGPKASCMQIKFVQGQKLTHDWLIVSIYNIVYTENLYWRDGFAFFFIDILKQQKKLVQLYLKASSICKSSGSKVRC